MSAPTAEFREHVHTEHGVERPDPYYWMRNREDEAVIRYVEAENAYTEAHTQHLADFRKTLYDEMLGRIQETDLSAPVRRGNYWYYTRTEEGQSYPIYCRKLGSVEHGEEEVLLDVNLLGAEHEYVKIGAFTVSPDHNLLAYSIDTNGRELFDLRIKDLRTDEHLPDLIPDIDTGATWATDNQTLLYNVLDDALRPYQVRRHRLGTPVDQDVVAYQEDDDKFRVGSWRTRSDAYLVIGSFSTLTTELRIIDAAAPESEAIVLAPRHEGLRYSVAHHGDWLYIVTNDSDDENGKHNDDAINYKLVRAPITSPTREQWAEVIPHRAEVQVVDVDTFANHLVLTEREGGLSHLRVIDLNDPVKDYRVPLQEPAYDLWGGNNPEFETNQFRFGYSSLITPSSTFEVNMETGEQVLLKQKPVLGGFDRDAYVSQRVTATAADGTAIPVSIVHRKDLVLDGQRPTLLYGYGSYGINIDPSFNSNRLSLLDRGVVFAIAHIRGSSTMGRPWYENGKFLHKRNTFTDFINAAEYLIEAGYTNPNKLCVQGGSAGGLLIGATINMRPELFHAAVAQVPFVDVVTTMLDDSIPLTANEWEEWGNPADKTYFDYMLSYSPYDNVAEQDYPHLLITSGLNDPRVQYWEPTKWTARLRMRKTDNNQLLLKTNMGAGHFAKSGRYGYLEDIAFVYAFLLDRFGLATAEATAPQP